MVPSRAVRMEVSSGSKLLGGLDEADSMRPVTLIRRVDVLLFEGV